MKSKVERAPVYVSVGLISVILCSVICSCTRQSVYPEPRGTERDVVIDSLTLKPEIPVFYSYRFHDKRINFFVIIHQGRICSFLDACVSCYTRKLGYQFRDGYFTCRACGMEYSVSQIEKGIGGCYPIRIEGRLQNGEYRVDRTTLEAASDKF